MEFARRKVVAERSSILRDVLGIDAARGASSLMAETMRTGAMKKKPSPNSR